MNHCMIDFHAGGKAVEHDPTHLGFKNSNQALSPLQVFFSPMNRSREVSFQLLRRSQQVFIRSVVNEQRSWSKHLLAEFRMSEEIMERNTKHSWLPDRTGLFASGDVSSNHSRLSFRASLLDGLAVFRRNPMRQHSKRLHLADTLLQLLLETSTLVLRHKHETRFRAELSRAHGK